MTNDGLQHPPAADGAPGSLRRTPVGVGTLVALLIPWLWLSPAMADMPPPAEPVETCTLEKQQPAGEECIMCGVSESDPAKCLKRLAQRGYQRRCRASGAPMWLEMWCRPGGAGARATPTPRASNGPLGY